MSLIDPLTLAYLLVGLGCLVFVRKGKPVIRRHARHVGNPIARFSSTQATPDQPDIEYNVEHIDYH